MKIIKKRILVLTSTFPRWKNDTKPPFVYELEKRLAHDFEIHVLAPHHYRAKKEELMEGLHVHRFKYFWPSKWQKLCDDSGILPNLKENKLLYVQAATLFIFELLAAIKICRKNKFYLIHAHWIIPQGIIAYLLKKLFKVPYIITSHGSDLHSLGFIELKKIILISAKKITTVSSFLAKDVEKIDKSFLKKIEVIPMGVDTKMFNPKKYDESIKKKYGITDKFLLFVGRLAPEKGVRYLIDAIPLLLKQYPKIKLLIIGTGSLEQALKNRVKKLKIESNICFLGSIRHNSLPSYFASADIFVSPSIKEGSPVTYLEAIASGTYLIIGDIPISRELVNNDNVGLIVKPNKNLIYHSIIKAFKKRKVKNLVNNVKKQYKWEDIIKKYKTILIK